MIVIMIAIPPSLRAASRSFVMRFPSPAEFGGTLQDYGSEIVPVVARARLACCARDRDDERSPRFHRRDRTRRRPLRRRRNARRSGRRRAVPQSSEGADLRLQDARLPLRGDRVGFYKAGGASGDSFCGCPGFTQSPQVVSLDNSTPAWGGV